MHLEDRAAKMDSIKIARVRFNVVPFNRRLYASQVDEVEVQSAGQAEKGTIHITQHHLIVQSRAVDNSEVWVSPFLRFYVQGFKFP